MSNEQQTESNEQQTKSKRQHTEINKQQAKSFRFKCISAPCLVFQSILLLLGFVKYLAQIF